MPITSAMRNSALSTRHSSPELYTVGSMAQIRDRYLAALHAAGYAVTVRDGSHISGVRGLMRDRMFLSGNWQRIDPRFQARTLCHEWVHAEQRRHYGRWGFSARYLRPAHAWVFEMQAYAESIRFMQTHQRDWRLSEIEAQIEHTVSIIWGTYPTLRVFGRATLERETGAILSAVSRR